MQAKPCLKTKLPKGRRSKRAVACTRTAWTIQKTLRISCRESTREGPKRIPSLRCLRCGDSTENFDIRVWIENPWEFERRHGLINDAIWWGLKKANIEIAFPQRDVHFDEMFTKAAGPGGAHMEEKENEQKKG